MGLLSKFSFFGFPKCFKSQGVLLLIGFWKRLLFWGNMYGTPSETVQIVDIILFLVLSYWYHFLTNSIYMLLTLKFKYKSWKVNSWNILLVKRYKNKYELVIANLFWFIFTTFIILWSIEQNSRHSGRVKKSSSCTLIYK